MPGRVLGVVDDQEGRPGEVRLGLSIAVLVRAVNRVDRPPEEEVVLRLEAGDHRVRCRDVHECQQSRGLSEIEAAAVRELAESAAPLHERVLDPETSGVGLFLRSNGAVRSAIRLDLCEVRRVATAIEVEWAVWPEVGRRVERERLDVLQLHVDGCWRRRRRLPNTRSRRRLDERDDVVESVVRAKREDLRGDLCSQGRPVRLRAPVGNRRHEGRVLSVDCSGLCGYAHDEDVVSSSCYGGLGRCARFREGRGQERLEATLGGRDCVVDRRVNHPREHL
jgi:hypothetical protein